MKKPLTSLLLAAFLLCGRSAAGAADAGDALDARQAESDASVEDAALEGAALEDAAAEDPAIASLRREENEIRDLIAKQLDPTVDPQSLFEVSLGDDAVVRVDAERLRLLLRGVDGSARPTRRVTPHPGDAESADAGVEASLWRARIALDRARLAFYELSADRRSDLLSAQSDRQRAAQAPPSDAQIREREAEEQRQATLRAAQSARTEAQRLVSTELARLLDVERAQSALGEDLARQKGEIADERAVTIGWQQRAMEAQGQGGHSADRTYDALRSALRGARDALSTALDQFGEGSTVAPGPGPDALADLRVDVDTGKAQKVRARVEAEASRLETEQESVLRERAAQLFDEIDKLNRERLALLDALSPSKRTSVTGFTAQGWHQAASEARQLTLILRYHRFVVGEWLLALRHPSRTLGGAVAGGALHIVEWLAALGAFVWWRRRATLLLRLAHGRAEEEDRRARLPTPSPASRALVVLAQVHRPIEWLALLFILRWLLPVATQEILEIRLISVLMTWIFGVALIVRTINALAGTGRSEGPRRDEPDSAALRLRSLQLVGRVVVIFGLILVISSMLVGRGTIYQWVFSTCWLASIPVLFTLVSWWRTIVLRRTERVRKPSRVQRWVLANSQGWSTAFAAAAVGGLYLFASGAARATRNWIGRFVITRRALAYLFRRQLGKREQETAVVGTIANAAFEVLGPEHPSTTWISNSSGPSLDQLANRIRERKGGVIALVGERGSGKSAALRRLRGDGTDTLLIDSLSPDADDLRARFAACLGLPGAATFEDAAAALALSPKIHALLLDNAHRFVQPVMGGLATFDMLLSTASRHTSSTTWVFALDQVIWQFLVRARGARPLFDDVIQLEPWREEEIVNLLQARTHEASLSPSFEPLLDRLPSTADEVDRQDALAQRAADYYRLLWDAATGNPGVALHMWRCSLGSDAGGETAVHPTAALDTTDLELLPDSTIFVLRAVLQLAPARAENIARGSMIRFADVADALRYAAARGYIEEHDGGYRVTWTWFRAVTVFLQRKHLLVTR